MGVGVAPGEWRATRVFTQGSDRIRGLLLVAVQHLGCNDPKQKRERPLKCSGFSLLHGESRSTVWM